MKARHNNPKLPHPPPNLLGCQLNDFSAIDDKYVISTRIRTGRSISGFPLPPSISADQRKELEGIVVKALMGLPADLKGDYYPLSGSTTYAPKPNGIDKETYAAILAHGARLASSPRNLPQRGEECIGVGERGRSSPYHQHGEGKECSFCLRSLCSIGECCGKGV